jgi:4'-phosphopantetheinyl transferase
VTKPTIARLRHVILSTDEQQKARRFRRAEDQRQFVASRALVRLALSHYFPVSAADWSFIRDCNGKPLIAAPAMSPPVQFSLSHTEGLVACLVSLSAEAAVDVEKVAYGQDWVSVAREVLSAEELSALNVLSGKDWTARFFDYWTLKEAYAKARGLGLSLPISDIGFELGPDDTIRARFASQINDDPLGWLFWHCHLSPQHAISVAAKRDLADECEIIHRLAGFDGINITSTQTLSGTINPRPDLSSVVALNGSGDRARFRGHQCSYPATTRPHCPRDARRHSGHKHHA